MEVELTSYNTKFCQNLLNIPTKKWHNRIPKTHFKNYMKFMPENSPTIQLPIIGYLNSPLSQKFGIPRQPNLVQIPATIEFIPPYDTPSAFEGLENFSHLWVVWQFHQNKEQNSFKPQVRPPRLGENEKIGVFATRSMYRPANIGLSVVKLEKIEILNAKTSLQISGADMVDGTPILDIKPYIAYSDSISNAKSGFAETQPMQKAVIFSENFYQAFNKLNQNSLSKILPETPSITQHDLAIIQQLIAQDPRPAYRQAEVDTIFTMRYKSFDIGFFMDNENRLVIDNVSRVG